MQKDPKSLKDEELVELVRAQDQELYSEVVERYQTKLIRYVAYLIREKDKAEDVVQEAFLKAFINLYSFNAKRKFSSWIYRIAHNEAINYVKKFKTQISLDENIQIADKANQNHLEKDYHDQETRKMLNLCLEKLPFIYREPLVLFYLEEKSYKEISDVLRLPINTIGTRISRGKTIMRNICEKNHLYGK